MPKTVGAQRKSFGNPEETRRFNRGRMEIVTVGDHTVGLATFQPGWKWSNDIKPIAQTESCQSTHLGYIVRGRMHVVHDDGTTVELQAGDAMFLAPGHDAWVVGDAPCVVFDVLSAASYAEKQR